MCPEGTWESLKHVEGSVSCSVVSDCDPTGCRPPGSSVLGILQARILEWVAMPSSMLKVTWP